MAAGHNLIAGQRYLIQQKFDNRAAEQHLVWSELVVRRLLQVRECACHKYEAMLHSE